MMGDAISDCISHLRFMVERGAEDPDYQPEMSACPSLIDCYRGDEKVASVAVGRSGEEPLLAVAALAAPGFAADIIVCGLDVIHSGLEEDPWTGTSWRRGMNVPSGEIKMGREMGWLTDAIFVTAANRADDVSFALIPYKFDPETREIAWGKPILHNLLSKALIHSMRSIMMLPPYTAEVAGIAFTTQDRVETDITVARTIAYPGEDLVGIGIPAHNSVALFSHSGTDRDQLFRRYRDKMEGES